jgi:hypothetical protein
VAGLVDGQVSVIEQGEAVGQPEIRQQPRGQDDRAACTQQIIARASQPNLPEVTCWKDRLDSGET